MKPDYFIPAQGEPRGLVHQVEPHVLHPLPGAKIPYARWQEQEAGLRTLLQDASKVAMQYSPRCAVPYVANVDAGTVEWIRGLGVEVVSYDITWMAYCGEEVPAPMREAFAAVAAEDLSASNQPTQNVEVDPTLLTRYLNEHLPVNPVRVVFESRKLSDSK